MVKARLPTIRLQVWNSLGLFFCIIILHSNNERKKERKEGGGREWKKKGLKDIKEKKERGKKEPNPGFQLGISHLWAFWYYYPEDS